MFTKYIFTYQVVAKVLAKLGKEEDGEDNVVHRIIMNPKAMTINQMYGHFDELNEWNDGILATTYRYSEGKMNNRVLQFFYAGTFPTCRPRSGNG